MNRRLPRLVLAALRGGAGKTTVSVALVSALRKRGTRVVPFKKGPDYIDAAWLARAAVGPCYNLDTFLIVREQVIRSFSYRAPEEGLSLIEGNRGLFDGMNPEGEHSTAELAKLLRSPVVLVLDCDKVTRTAGAMVLGCQTFDPNVDIRAVILNRVATDRQAALVRTTVEARCGIPVLGVIPRLGEADVPFPERHLGLVPPQEHGCVEEVLDRAARLAEEHLDLDGLIRVAAGAPPWEAEAVRPAAVEQAAAAGVTIGVIRDAAFQFYYQENVEALVESGARIVEISAVSEDGLPDVDALYIGGGFPEAQAGLLAGNEGFRRSLRDAAEGGLPIYAECGGFIYLGESLTIGDRRYPMVGALPVSFALEQRPQGHGYTILEVDGENPFYPRGMRVKGHEFHYCRIVPRTGGVEPTAFRVRRGTGLDGRREGMIRKNILAGFTHVHALGTPEWAPALIAAARRHRTARHGGTGSPR